MELHEVLPGVDLYRYLHFSCRSSRGPQQIGGTGIRLQGKEHTANAAIGCAVVILNKALGGF
jgi:hypothetical protein